MRGVVLEYFSYKKFVIILNFSCFFSFRRCERPVARPIKVHTPKGYLNSKKQFLSKHLIPSNGHHHFKQNGFKKMLSIFKKEFSLKRLNCF